MPRPFSTNGAGYLHSKEHSYILSSHYIQKLTQNGLKNWIDVKDLSAKLTKEITGLNLHNLDSSTDS